MRLGDFKLTKLEFNKKIEMENVEKDLAEIDYQKINMKELAKRTKPYEDMTHYKTVKEFFMKSVKENADRPCILEKPSHKEAYVTKTYKEFGEDVLALGTALIKKLDLKNKRVIIIGETQYGWYMSYMAMLCGVGIAVPTDKELPLNELENIAKRSRASAIIYSPAKAEAVNKLKESIPEIQYFIEMKSDKALDGKNIVLLNLVEEGKKIIASGDDSFEKIKIDPEAF